MAQPYVGEIRMFGGNYAPAGWMMCNGQTVSISEFETLYNLIGTTYGGDGQSTFGLPDLRGRLPVHVGPGFVLAQNGGAEEVTLTQTQVPVHTHALIVSTDPATTTTVAGQVLGTPASATPFFAGAPNLSLRNDSISSVGGSQPHTNMQPYLCVNFIISLFGIYPSPT
jgi:microcystin-dependent protein